jgi:hypothetical protein
MCKNIGQSKACTQAINPVGRELALQRGANILMPILTPTQYRVDYQLYEGNACFVSVYRRCARFCG